LRNYMVARSLRTHRPAYRSATVVVPCRNERGNVEQAVTRFPDFCEDLEVVFVEGGAKMARLRRCSGWRKSLPHKKQIKVLRQLGEGKADAVRTGFRVAEKEVLMILDGDLTVPPESLPRFFPAIANGKGEFINGTRMVYPMEKQAMRSLNLVANRLFSWLFTWPLNQRYTDTLCGTKVLSRRHYERLVENRQYFGNCDPFGDFELIFGATKRNLKAVEMPIRCAARA
jgi:glycosyltransferase involved in cell wall biosynthesis